MSEYECAACEAGRKAVIESNRRWLRALLAVDGDGHTHAHTDGDDGRGGGSYEL